MLVRLLRRCSHLGSIGHPARLLSSIHGAPSYVSTVPLTFSLSQRSPVQLMPLAACSFVRFFSRQADTALQRIGTQYATAFPDKTWRVVEALIDRFDRLSAKLNEPESLLSPAEYATLAKELAAIESAAEMAKEVKAKRQSLLECDEIIRTSVGPNADKELIDMAQEEKALCLSQLPELEENLLDSVVTSDEDDSRNAILEVRAGTGGSEASLFTADVFHMYEKFAALKRWKFEILSIDASMEVNGQSGYHAASALISGRNVFGTLRHEVGTHRVQRIPLTESKGRVHTSAMMVTLMPEAQDVDIKIHDRDLKIDTYRSSGNGGQSVNTTDSAVRITHLPTGVVIAMQDERSQVQNKAKALRVLRSRLYEMQRAKLESARLSLRRDQMGSGERSDRIRTYNFPQGRVTDHRVNVNMFDVPAMLRGELLDDFITAMTRHEKSQRLMDMLYGLERDDASGADITTQRSAAGTRHQSASA